VSPLPTTCAHVRLERDQRHCTTNAAGLCKWKVCLRAEPAKFALIQHNPAGQHTLLAISHNSGQKQSYVLWLVLIRGHQPPALCNVREPLDVSLGQSREPAPQFGPQGSFYFPPCAYFQRSNRSVPSRITQGRQCAQRERCAMRPRWDASLPGRNGPHSGRLTRSVSHPETGESQGFLVSRHLHARRQQ